MPKNFEKKTIVETKLPVVAPVINKLVQTLHKTESVTIFEKTCSPFLLTYCIAIHISHNSILSYYILTFEKSFSLNT